MPDTPDLHDLLERASTHPPPERHDVPSVVRRAHRSPRLHRTGSTVALVAVVAAVAGAGTLVAGQRGDRPQPAQNGIVGLTVHPQRGMPVATDRLIVTAEVAAPDLEQGNDQKIESVSAEGQVLVVRPTLRVPGRAITEYNRYGLVPAGGGPTAWLPAPPGATYADDHAPSGPMVKAVGEGHVLWVDSDRNEASVYDLAERTWVQFSLKAGRLGRDLARDGVVNQAVIADGRIWLTVDTMENGGDATRTLWSLPVTGVDRRAAGAEFVTPRDEGRVGDWDVDGSTLAFTEATNQPVSRLTVRDLASGDERTFDPLSGDRCNQLGLDLAGDRIALTEYCGHRGKVRDDRVHVVGTDGQQVVTAQGDTVDSGAIGADALAVTWGDPDGGSWGPGAGTYVYDFTDGSLTRISTGLSSYGGLGAGGDTLAWSTPIDGEKGQTAWAGTWR